MWVDYIHLYKTMSPHHASRKQINKNKKNNKSDNYLFKGYMFSFSYIFFSKILKFFIARDGPSAVCVCTSAGCIKSVPFPLPAHHELFGQMLNAYSVPHPGFPDPPLTPHSAHWPLSALIEPPTPFNGLFNTY